jgi:hypothetical protein
MDSESIKVIDFLVVVMFVLVVPALSMLRRIREGRVLVTKPYGVNAFCLHCGESVGRNCTDKSRADSECYYCHTADWVQWKDLEDETAKAKDLARLMNLTILELKIRLRDRQAKMGLIIDGERVRPIEPSQFKRGRLVHRT